MTNIRIISIFLVFAMTGCVQSPPKEEVFEYKKDLPVSLTSDAYMQPKFSVDNENLVPLSTIESGESPLPVQTTQIHLPKKLKSTESYYRIKAGQRVDQILKSWVVKNNADADAVWQHDEYLYVQADAEFFGSLFSVISSLVESLGEDGKRLNITIFNNGYVLVEGDKK